MRALIVSSALAAALLASPSAVQAQNSAYFLKSASGTTNCAYQSMAQCERAKKGGDLCLSRAQAGTTGYGGGTSSPGNSSGSMSPPPSSSGGMAPPSPTR